MRRISAWIVLCSLALVLAWVWHPWQRLRAGLAADRGSPAAYARSEPSEAAPAPDTAVSSPAAKVSSAGETADPPGQAPGTADPLLQSGFAPAEALRLLDWCGELPGADASSQFESEWQWLGPEAAELERSRYVQARSWMVARCGPWALPPLSQRAQALREALIDRAARSADISDRLRALELARTVPDAADVVAARRLLEEALAAGRPELLRDIGRVLERSFYRDPEHLGPYAGGGATTLFTLLACDLGMPCGIDSEPVRLNCALRGRCGYVDYETLVFDAWHGARAAELIQRHRAELLRRIRAGDIAGLFDPVPLPPPPSG